MNNILYFCIASFIVSYLIYRKTKGEIMSPSFVTTITLGIAAFLLYLLSWVWLIDIHEKSLWILLGGLVAVTVGDLVAFQRFHHAPRIRTNGYRYIKIKYCNVLLFIYLLSALLYYYEIRKIGASIGYDDVSAIGEVKADIKDLSSQMNPIVRQMYKVVTAACLVHSYIFANNVFLVKTHWRRELKHLIPIIAMIIITISSGGRLNIFKSMMGVIFIGYTILRESSGWRKRFIKNIIILLVPVIVGFCAIFSALSLIVKNNGDDSKESLEYLYYYAGSPIQVFNLKIVEGRKKWSYDHVGYATFNGLYSTLGIKDKQAKHIGNGMIPLGGRSDYAGNASTIFCTAYLDFGFAGMLAFIFVCYYLFGRYYYKYIVNTTSTYLRNRRLVAYAYVFSLIVVMAFYDNCFWILVSPTGGLTFCSVLFLYYIYFKKLLVFKLTTK